MMREYHVRICEGLGVQLPGSTRHSRPGRTSSRVSYVRSCSVRYQKRALRPAKKCQYPTSLKSESSGLLGFWSRMSHLLTICGSSLSNDSWVLAYEAE